MNLTERRFHEGLGERYMKGDPTTVRCQATSKTKLRKFREERGNPDLTSDDLWPEAQCGWPAVNGTYACDLHNGKSKEVATRKTSVFEYMPVDLRAIAESFVNNPELFSRYTEIIQMMTRTAQLFDDLKYGLGAEGFWESIQDGLKQISEGDIVSGSELIGDALHRSQNEHEIWDEIRENAVIIDKLTRTQFSIEKDLQTMATREQLFAMVGNLATTAINAFEQATAPVRNHKDYDRMESKFRDIIANEIRKSYNLRS